MDSLTASESDTDSDFSDQYDFDVDALDNDVNGLTLESTDKGVEGMLSEENVVSDSSLKESHDKMFNPLTNYVTAERCQSHVPHVKDTYTNVVYRTLQVRRHTINPDVVQMLYR